MLTPRVCVTGSHVLYILDILVCGYICFLVAFVPVVFLTRSNSLTTLHTQTDTVLMFHDLVVFTVYCVYNH